MFSLLPILAEADTIGTSSPLANLIAHVVSVIVFSAIGLIVFGIGFWLFTKLCPFSLRKELEEDQNTAIAIIMGSMIIGLAIIIAAAVHG